LQHIGNDDVAGIAAHEVGRAFVGWVARDGHPFREKAEEELPGRAIGSLAAVYLGLGVIATNAAYHSRASGNVQGNLAFHAHAVDRAGGLDVDDLAFLLAVQAEVRDDVLPALASLRPTQAQAVAAWRAALENHEDELKQLLGVSYVPDDVEAPDRAAMPREVPIEAAFEEALLTKQNHGKIVFRVAETRLRAHAAIGGLIGMIGGLVAVPKGPGAAVLASIVIVITTVVGFVLGWRIGGTRQRYRCATCESFVEAGAPVCRACGGAFAGDITHRSQRLDAEERLEAASRATAGQSSDAVNTSTFEHTSATRS
jgi:hypothetical protein